jgi:hypothetical protein
LKKIKVNSILALILKAVGNHSIDFEEESASTMRMKMHFFIQIDCSEMVISGGFA